MNFLDITRVHARVVVAEATWTVRLHKHCAHKWVPRHVEGTPLIWYSVDPNISQDALKRVRMDAHDAASMWADGLNVRFDEIPSATKVWHFQITLDDEPTRLFPHQITIGDSKLSMHHSYTSADMARAFGHVLGFGCIQDEGKDFHPILKFTSKTPLDSVMRNSNDPSAPTILSRGDRMAGSIFYTNRHPGWSPKSSKKLYKAEVAIIPKSLLKTRRYRD
jgi:hypothetical protein